MIFDKNKTTVCMCQELHMKIIFQYTMYSAIIHA
jgi:hypothetical protein